MPTQEQMTADSNNELRLREENRVQGQVIANLGAKLKEAEGKREEGQSLANCWHEKFAALAHQVEVARTVGDVVGELWQI